MSCLNDVNVSELNYLRLSRDRMRSIFDLTSQALPELVPQGMLED